VVDRCDPASVAGPVPSSFPPFERPPQNGFSTFYPPPDMMRYSFFVSAFSSPYFFSMVNKRGTIFLKVEGGFPGNDRVLFLSERLFSPQTRDTDSGTPFFFLSPLPPSLSPISSLSSLTSLWNRKPTAWKPSPPPFTRTPYACPLSLFLALFFPV